MLRYILFHHQTTTFCRGNGKAIGCVISSFITKPQPYFWPKVTYNCCVISSFITKPQPNFAGLDAASCCVISSFITKPQRVCRVRACSCVALYPLSSPNHNGPQATEEFTKVALYPLSSPNHNSLSCLKVLCMLRYILFHHQTTTWRGWYKSTYGCVISSFITKPQLYNDNGSVFLCCVISSFITKPQQLIGAYLDVGVALYPLSSPNHNLCHSVTFIGLLRYILFHHQTTTRLSLFGAFL